MTRVADEISELHQSLLERLRAERQPGGWWLGELSPSALGTATAVSALAMVAAQEDRSLIAAGCHWLIDDQNADGGWGDTPDSPSNLSTTLLCMAALRLASGESDRCRDGGACSMAEDEPGAGCHDCGVCSRASGLSAARGAVAPSDRRVAASSHPTAGGPDRRVAANSHPTGAGAGRDPAVAIGAAEAYVTARAGATAGERIEALCRLYGEDRTFAVPILINLALAGLVSWEQIPRLPFELAVLPHAVMRLFRVEVVSYALPALIAIGQLLHDRRPTRLPPLRWLRSLLRGPTLRRLRRIQPETGGFIEAVPLTGFVLMSLAAAGQGGHPVVTAGLEFLRRTARLDGSWPIDSNLSVWLTSQAATAIAAAPADERAAGDRAAELQPTLQWLAAQQHRRVHPFTSARPGGWGWTHLAGGVPDADDTAAALLALRAAMDDCGQGSPVGWLLAATRRHDEQSAVEGTCNRMAASGHGTRTFEIAEEGTTADAAVVAPESGVKWLLKLQNGDGGWPTFCRGWGRLPFDRSGADLTAHAVRALNAWIDLLPRQRPVMRRAIDRGVDYLVAHQLADGSWLPLWFGNQSAPGGLNPTIGTARVLAAWRDLDRHGDAAALRGIQWLLTAQHADGGWGAAPAIPPTVEETALALDGLCGFSDERCQAACDRAAQWLYRKAQLRQIDNPSPLGLYFTSLWYWERLYPLTWSLAALGRYLRSRSEFNLPG